MSNTLFQNATALSELFYYYGPRSGKEAAAEAFHNQIYDPKNTTWIGIGGDGSRAGSIGIAVPAGYDPNNRNKWSPKPTIQNSSRYYSGHQLSFVDIYFDKGRKVKNQSVYYDHLYLLDNYTGGIVYKLERTPAEKVEPKVVLDRLGNELNVGDFICYVGRQAYTTSMGDIFFGFVERKTDGGTLFVKNIKLSDDDKQRESRITSPDRVTKLNKDVIDQLMLRRLTF